METIKTFESLTKLNKFEKQNKLRIVNIDFDKETKLWVVSFVNT